MGGKRCPKIFENGQELDFLFFPTRDEEVLLFVLFFYKSEADIVKGGSGRIIFVFFSFVFNQ